MRLRYLALASLLLCGANLGWELGWSYFWCCIPLIVGLGYATIMYLVVTTICMMIVVKAMKKVGGKEDTDEHEPTDNGG